MNNRTTNNRSIRVKNDNYLTARRLLYVIEHSLTDQAIGRYSSCDVRTDAPFRSYLCFIIYLEWSIVYIARSLFTVKCRYTVSHFSYAPPFQGPHFFTKMLKSNILYDYLLKLTFHLFDEIEKYRNHSCELFCNVKRQF